MAKFADWIKLSSMISSAPPLNPTFNCPECHRNEIDFQYVGDSVTKIGFLDVWCKSCMKGIHISRVVIPKSANMLTFGEAGTKSRIPDFKQIIR